MNYTILKGNIGNDPAVKTFEWGKVAKFSLATSEKYTNKKGEIVTETDWHNCVFRGKQAETIEKYVHKGDQLLVIGKLKYRNYDDKEGRTIYITEIIGDRFEFCGNANKSENKEGQYQGGKKEEKQSAPLHESGYSDIIDLPCHVRDAEENQDMDEPPF